MKRFVLLMIAALLALALVGTTVWVRGSSGGHSGSSRSSSSSRSSHSRPSKSKSRAKKKKKKKKRKAHTKRHKPRKHGSAKGRSSKKNRVKANKSRRSRKPSSAKRPSKRHPRPKRDRGTAKRDKKPGKRDRRRDKASSAGRKKPRKDRSRDRRGLGRKGDKGKRPQLTRRQRLNRLKKAMGPKKFRALQKTRSALAPANFAKSGLANKMTASAAGTARAALGKMTTGNPLGARDRDALSDLGDTVGGALQNAIDTGLAVEDAERGRRQDDEEDREWDRKFLKVRNVTRQPLRVYIHYRTRDRREWTWLPEEPVNEEGSVHFVLKPGQWMRVWDGRRRVDASRVRIWAETKSGKELAEHKNKDFWLVPEETPHVYYAPEKETEPYLFETNRRAALND
jgi:hypothetical protein